ncbi:Long-chain specific acyl-CoA dehydrogenase [Mycobacterium tuberculosis]|nr:Long-chain specific acyl-CoA dehydrogenase [Mycobacterium tuberculosis]CKM84513.1 Long-chain specific acyl-CoA dehydrogenase [Mycobacterium tuberculosis]CKZ73189.1 Long-chain specific acyl-CoA dehydrogenase [Mycobacterium tuberculosis]
MGSATKYQRTLFEPEHELFRESYRAFLDRHVAPYHDEWEKTKIVDRGVWLEAGKQGFLGMAVPEEYGGGGNADFRYNTVITEETCAGRYSGIGFGLHNDIVAPYLLALATEEQKRRWFPNFCTGELITAIAMTEPGTGSDLQGITTRAVKHGDHYVLNGSKTFITNGINSDLVIVVAQTDPEKGAQGFSLLVVERGMAGFERGRQLDKIGLDAQDTAELSFTDVAVPAENLLGQEGMGFIYLMQTCRKNGSRSPSWRPRGWNPCWSRHCSTPRSARRSAGRSVASRTADSCWPSWQPRPLWCASWSTNSLSCTWRGS